MATIEQGSVALNSSTTISVLIKPFTIVGNGVQTVPTAGVSVQLASSNATQTVTVRAFATNTGKIYVGSSTVSSANGFQLSPQETISLDIANISSIWIDADVSGEGVSYIYGA